MSEDYKFQVSEKAGDAIIVVRGDTFEEFLVNIGLAVDAEALEAVGSFSTAVKTLAPVRAVKALIPGSTVTYSGPSETVPDGAVSKDGYAPDDEDAIVTCVHGQRVWFSSPKGWKAWFCPSKNEGDKCKPAFVPKGR